MKSDFYSVRMRASSLGRHLSGGERMVPRAEIGAVVSALTERGLQAAEGAADEVHCQVERIDAATLHYATLPDVSTCQVADVYAGRQLAVSLLTQAGVQEPVARQAVELLADGAGPGGTVMRGAVLMDVATGQRLEPNPERGIRVSRMDVTAACRLKLDRLLQGHALGHRRVSEALVLAGKILAAPGAVAELCWSDDPHYITGYVAAPSFGYRRISILKSCGDPRGGRVLFVDLSVTTVTTLIHYLEKTPVLFSDTGKILPASQGEAAHA